MPHIAVSMLPGRSRELKQALAEKLRDSLMETLGVEKENVSVSIEDVELEDWGRLMEGFPEETIFVNPYKK